MSVKSKLNLDQIASHWNRTDAYKTTTHDKYIAHFESGSVCTHLFPSKAKVLEVGCGDGQHSKLYSSLVTTYTAIDTSQTLIERASAVNKGRNIEYLVSSVLGQLDGLYDCIISQRCLINLETWDNQKKAIDNMTKHLKPGGLLLINEGFVNGLTDINIERKRFGLDAIKVANYNLFLSKHVFEGYVKKHYNIIEKRNCGTYLLLSRVLYPAMIYPEEPKHDSVFNEKAHELVKFHYNDVVDAERYSYHLFYALEKRRI